MRFMPRQSRMAVVTMALPVCGLIMASTIMPPSSSIRTATLLKRFSIPQNHSRIRA
ncbi:UNVERIFIED_ORG: hypothetical protein GGD59_001930 [Rhizobium esperanzae]